MKHNISVYSILFLMIVFWGCTPKKDFNSELKTKQKPWTSEDFYNNPDNFQFAIVGDRTGGMRPGVFKEGIEKLNLVMPEFVLSVGDLIQGYTTDTAQISKEWKEVNQVISELKMPFFYLPGNHDITNEIMAEEWEKRYGQRYYSFEYKNVLFVILDSNDDKEFHLTRDQTNFVINSLKKNKNVRWTFLLMHHPLWTYETDGMFQEIQDVLKDRKHTVIAGHEHRYRQEEINGSNYYVLATTGGHSALHGEMFGQFDHISWITMSNDGPIMANLKLDGILPHDIATMQTRAKAHLLLSNAQMEHEVKINKGVKFKNGTLMLNFKNPSETDMILNLNVYHHHQLQIEYPENEVLIPAGENKQIQIPLSSNKALAYDNIDLIRTDWEIKYKGQENEKYILQGKAQFEVKPTLKEEK